MKRKKYPKDNRLSYRRFYFRRYIPEPERKAFFKSLFCDYDRCNVTRIRFFYGWRLHVIAHYSELIDKVNRKMRKK